MKRDLDRYAAKRTFTKTPEPGPRVASARKGPLLFVVQKHAASRLHYDFRLELDGVLKSWAVPKGPSLDPADKRMAVEVEDHPFEYASFEGVIPEKLYGAGNVIVWDCGVYSPDEGGEYSFDNRDEAEERLRKELADGKLSFTLCGDKLKGSFTLVKTTGGEKQWLLIKHRDRFVRGIDVLARSASVLSGRTLDDMVPDEPLQRLDAGRLAPSGPPESTPITMSPMLAEPGERPRADDNWLYEPKLDGYRVIAIVRDGQVQLQSRRGLDYTKAFPEVVADLEAQPARNFILDGEIVALDTGGRPSFNALQNRAQLKTEREIGQGRQEAPVVLLCFDLLHFAGLNLRGARYLERRRWLTQCLMPSSNLQLVHTSTDGEKLYEASLASGFEGVVAKRKDSTYQPGKRSNAWLKLKSTKTAEFVVGGYTRGKGTREPLGALLLGYWSGKKLHYAGHVGSGFNAAGVASMLAQLKRLERKARPFAEQPPRNRPTTWTEPELVAEVEFADWTPDGNLRAPVFLRLRDDIDPKNVRAGPKNSTPDRKKNSRPGRLDETPARATDDSSGGKRDIEAVLEQLAGKEKELQLEVAGARIKLTNLDREYWPAVKDAKSSSATGAITKRDLLRYLAQVSPYMLPHLRDRPLTMIRMPEGIHGERFFQKHWEQSKPDFVEAVTVFSGHKGEEHEYLLANNLPTLLWLGQVGTLEFHVWHSRAKIEADAPGLGTDYASSLESLEASVLNHPDYLVFDIDPYIYSGKEAQGEEPQLNKKGFATGKRVAFWLRELLREMSLEAVVKTSGKTGLHVFVPIERIVTFDQVRTICETVGRHLMRAHPRDITLEWSVPKRTGKIFMDYNMNVRGKTLNVAYSPRGVPGAPVSMPLTWDELEAAEPMDFLIGDAEMLARLERAGDRWHDALSAKQSLSKAFGSSSRSK
jgi:bifunctional non-homologous end joining protein LigD